MKITQDVRDYADGLSEEEKKAIEGMADKSVEFKDTGSAIYS